MIERPSVFARGRDGKSRAAFVGYGDPSFARIH